MNQVIEKLLEKYYDGETTLEEEKQLRQFFQKEDIPSHLASHAAQFRYFVESGKAQPSIAFNDLMLSRFDPPKAGPVRRFTSWVVRIAAGVTLLVIGFAGGLAFYKIQFTEPTAFFSGDASSAQEIKNVLAFEQTVKTSASERIQAVNQSYELSKVDRSITQLLINTLNFDPNINVRLAACQALLRFKDEPDVSEALIQSLGIQTDPNLQITLIEVLVTIKEKRAIDQFQQIARSQEVLDVVRLKAQEGLDRLNNKINPET